MKENEKPNYYSIIPASVRYSDRLSCCQKLMFAEITSLSNKKGYCYASNDYFAKLYNKSKETISRWISDLSNEGFVRVELDRKAGNKRRIFAIPIDENVNTPIDKNVNTSYQKRQHNNKENTNYCFKNNNKIVVDGKLYKKFVAEYDIFIRRELGVKGRYDAGNLKCLKEIMLYLYDMNVEVGETGENLKTKMLDAWKYVLNENNWSKLSDFHRKQVQLRQINANFVTILKELREASKIKPGLNNKDAEEYLSMH